MGNTITEGYADSLDVVFNMDLFHIEKGVKDLDKLSKRLIRAAEKEALEAFVNMVVQKLQTNVSLAGYPELAARIKTRHRRGRIEIWFDAPHAVYLEYGTGIEGSVNPHPLATTIGWGYMVGKFSGRGSGWWYPADESYGFQKTFIGLNGQMYAYTRGGLSAGMFTHRTLEWAKRNYTRYFRKVLRTAIKSRYGK